jgi:hypothetical protein
MTVLSGDSPSARRRESNARHRLLFDGSRPRTPITDSYGLIFG